MKDTDESSKPLTVSYCHHTIGVERNVKVGDGWKQGYESKAYIGTGFTSPASTIVGENKATAPEKLNTRIGINAASGEAVLHGIDWLKSEVSQFRKRPHWLEKCALVIGVMLERKLQRDQESIQLSKGLLCDLVGDDAARYIPAFLKRIGAIERANADQRWFKKVEHRYRFKESYLKRPCGVLKISDGLMNRYRTWSNQRLLRAINDNQVNKLLWDDLQHLSLHPSHIEAIPKFDASEMRREWAWHHSIQAIQHKKLTFSCRLTKPKDNIGRVYTTFSYTPSELRRYALLDGKPLVCIDVKCSQPFLHASLLPKGEERDRYLKSVKAGTFYEDIGTAAGLTKCTHSDLKKKIFGSVFYGKTRPVERDRLWAAFSKLYPALATRITEKKKANNRDLAVEMQDLEASIVVFMAAAALKAKFPHIRLLTVHDSIYVPAEFVADAREALERSFESHMHLVPKFHEEPSAIRNEAIFD